MPTIKIRKLKIQDAKRMRELFADDSVLRYLLYPKPAKKIKLKEEIDFVKKNIRNYKKKMPEIYTMAITADNVFIGAIGANKIDYKNQCIVIGYWIGKNYWGKGYVKKAVKLFCKFLREKFKVVRIEAFVFTKNIASQKVLLKSGFVFEGIKHKAIKKNDKFLDEKMYALVR